MEMENLQEELQTTAEHNNPPFEQVIHVTRLARAFVPFQKPGELFSHDTALKNGTIFPELYMPHEGRR